MASLTLTYANHPDGSRPFASQVFHYPDMQLFYNALRQAAYRKSGQRGVLRYITCGEVGSKGTQRVHWHTLLFAAIPFTQLGEWRDFQTKSLIQHGDIVPDKRYWWSLWPHGHIHYLEPGYKGIFYVLKYALKHLDGLNASRGTNRINNIDNWPASFFMMSKKPAIGVPYFEKLFLDMEEKGWMSPNLRFKIPDASGFYYPSGYMRQFILSRIRAVIIRYYQKHGVVPAQFRSFVKSLKGDGPLGEFNSDLDMVRYGEEKTNRSLGTEGWYIDIDAAQARWSNLQVTGISGAGHDKGGQDDRKLGSARGYSIFNPSDQDRSGPVAPVATGNSAQQTAEIVANCGGIRPCATCWRTLEVQGRTEEFNRFYFDAHENYRREKGVKTLPWDDFEAEWRSYGFPSPFCQRSGQPAIESAFRAWRGIARLGNSVTHAGAYGSADIVRPAFPPTPAPRR